MKEQTKILIAATKDQAEYDNACKNLFKNKEILAPVLKYAIGEYKDFTVEEIIGFIDGVSISIDTPVDDDFTLTPKFEKNRILVNYDLDGGSLAETNPTKYTVNDEITLKNPTKTGYTFAGWIGTELEEATQTVTIEK